ncbi:Uncharacterised protein [Mycobacteroides abscessus subsp. abscessus]|nr:Uncharacterised protein [Mycobacteroides abscessus subsp. abscessus]
MSNAAACTHCGALSITRWRVSASSRSRSAKDVLAQVFSPSAKSCSAWSTGDSICTSVMNFSSRSGRSQVPICSVGHMVRDVPHHC